MVTFITFLCVLTVIIGFAGALTEVLASFLGVAMMAGGILILSLLFVYYFLKMAFGKRPYINWWAVLFGSVSCGISGYLGFLAYKNPVWDVTTDLAKPPKFVHPAFAFPVTKGGEFLEPSFQLDREYDASMVVKQEFLYPDIRGVGVKAPQKSVYDEIIKMMRKEFPDWEVVLEDPKGMRAEFEQTSILLHNVNDVAIEVRPDKVYASDSTVEIRARSRLGYTDFGLNSNLVRDIRARVPLAVKPLEDKVAGERAAEEKKKAEAEAAAAAAATATATNTATATATGTTKPAPAKPLQAAAPPKPAPVPPPAPVKSPDPKGKK